VDASASSTFLTVGIPDGDGLSPLPSPSPLSPAGEGALDELLAKNAEYLSSEDESEITSLNAAHGIDPTRNK
jgi:hypothetical protein